MEMGESTDKSELQKEAPPTYDAATTGAPPTYEQLFGVRKMKREVMEAKQNSSKGMFAVKLSEIICGSAACMCGLIILAALPVAMIVIGSVYLNDCEGQRNIPIWLIVFGVFSLVSTLINVTKRIFKMCLRKDESEEEGTDYGRKTGSCLESLISLFLFIWIIIGSVWVFGFYDEYKDRDCAGDPGNGGCCHPVPYLFSFVTLIVIYVFSFLSLCCCCCCFVCLAFLVGASDHE